MPASKPPVPEFDFVVVVLHRNGRRTPFGPARPRDAAEALALRLRAFHMHAVALPGSVVEGKFKPRVPR